MTLSHLTQSVEQLAAAMAHLTDAELGSGAYAWGEYAGVRMALLGTAQDLDELAARLLVQRGAAGNPPTHAQLLLARHREAYRGLLALLVGIEPAELTRAPAQGEWSVAEALRHIDSAERGFFISILAGLDAQVKGVAAAMPPREQRAAFLAEADPAPAEQSAPVERLAAYARLHFLVETKLAGLTGDQLQTRSPFWEPTQPSVGFRMGRFTAHLREHTVQVEKTLLALGHIPGEAALHIRTLFGALAGVEGSLMGAAELAGECAELAQTIARRAEEVAQAVADSAALIAAIRAGDSARVDALLAQNPRLVDASDANQQSAVLVATYAHQFAIAQKLHAAGAELDLFSAAAIGYLPEVEQYYAWKPESINWYAKDGFTPLQLAGYFGQEEMARYLTGKGADVHAVSKNGMELQALHAAVAGRNAAIVRALIDAGADVHAQQAGGFTALMAAEQNGDEEIVALLREAMDG
ncbi:MAG: ankyrin repeat domain-containing protein [Chloroflexi bacterium]|nr:ankyrin repeat domain-containing protein [Chloroflexota bacterium]